MQVATKTFSDLFDSTLMEWSRVRTLLSQERWAVPASKKKKTVCPQFRSGHKDEQINRRKLTSSLVQLEFDSKRNMHCSVVLTSIL